jgi:hypothetical protein
MGLAIRVTNCRSCETEISSSGKFNKKVLKEFYYLGTRFEMCEECYEVEMKKMKILNDAGFETDYDFLEGDSTEKD